MTPSWAKVGSRCVCVDVQPMVGGTPCPLSYGTVYTIVGIHLSDHWVAPAGVNATGTVLDVGVVNPDDSPSVVPGFGIWRFRPLVSKTESEDLAVFRRIADLAGVDEALRRLEGVE